MKGAMKLSRVLFGAGAGVGLGLGSSVAMASAKENCGLSYELLRRQNACTSNEVIRCMEGSKAFAELAAREGQLMVARDEEDEQKLWVGIEKSITRGVLKKIPPPVVTRIAVYGMTPEEVADHIISKVSTASDGCVIVLQGQSGTGKGTTTTTLLDKLPNSVSWSNGNVFRSLTLLAATHCKNEGIDLKENVDKVMTPENVARWMSMLRFEKIADKTFDVRLVGMGFNARVSEIQNTILKEPLVAKNVPTVAEWSQGEVVTFGVEALRQMCADGLTVIFEGLTPAVNYVQTPYRFELIMSDLTLLGQRRAAQRVMAACVEYFQGKPEPTRQVIVKRAKHYCEEWTTRI